MLPSRFSKILILTALVLASCKARLKSQVKDNATGTNGGGGDYLESYASSMAWNSGNSLNDPVSCSIVRLGVFKEKRFDYIVDEVSNSFKIWEEYFSFFASVHKNLEFAEFAVQNIDCKDVSSAKSVPNKSNITIFFGPGFEDWCRGKWDDSDCNEVTSHAEKAKLGIEGSFGFASLFEKHKLEFIQVADSDSKHGVFNNRREGYIYIAPDFDAMAPYANIKALSDTGEPIEKDEPEYFHFIRTMLRHEIGHSLGFSHIDDTVMTADLKKTLNNSDIRDTLDMNEFLLFHTPPRIAVKQSHVTDGLNVPQTNGSFHILESRMPALNSFLSHNFGVIASNIREFQPQVGVIDPTIDYTYVKRTIRLKNMKIVDSNNRIHEIKCGGKASSNFDFPLRIALKQDQRITKLEIGSAQSTCYFDRMSQRFSFRSFYGHRQMIIESGTDNGFEDTAYLYLGMENFIIPKK